MNRKISKILAVHYFYYPVNAIGTRRNTNVLNSICKLVDPEEVMVVSTKNSYIEKDVSLKVKFNAIRVTTFDFYALGHFKRFIFSKRKKKTGKNSKQTFSAPSPSISKYLRFKNTFPGNLILGEGGWLYIASAFFKANSFVNKNTLILTSFSPFSDHIVAYLLKLAHPKATWVADFRDLYLQEGVDNVYAYKFHKWLLKKILAKADLVTTVSEGLCNSLATFSKNAVVLRNGIDLEMISKRGSKKIFEKFTVSYTGSLYGTSRDPSPVLAAISNAIADNKIDPTDISLNYAGLDGSIWNSLASKFGLNKVNTNHGMITKNTALDLQNNSVINIAITWCDKNNKGILTGKFFEYIEAGNIILVLIRGDKDWEFERIVKSTNVGAFFYEHETALIEQYIINLYKEWKECKYVDANYNIEALKDYGWEKQVRYATVNMLNIALPLND